MSDHSNEEKISQLTESLTSLLMNMPALTFSKDVKDGRYLACNRMFAEYARMNSPEEVVGNTDFEIFDRETARHFVEDDKKAIEMDMPYVFFEDVVDAIGNPRQFRTTKFKYTDTKGRMCLLGMSVDVSDVEALRKEKLEARAAYNKAQDENLIHARIAKALSVDYIFIYCVDTTNDHYIDYSYDSANVEVELERQGDDFFDLSRKNINIALYEDDREGFLEKFTKDNIMSSIEETGLYKMSYRLILDGTPTYVNLRSTRLENDNEHIVISVSKADENE